MKIPRLLVTIVRPSSEDTETVSDDIEAVSNDIETVK